MKNKNRKYDKFKIKIIYHNGDVEEVKYRSNVNTSNYNEMMKVYKSTKEKYLNDKEVAVIDFVGVSEKGEVGVIFTKEISKYIDEDISNNLDRDSREVVDNIINLFNVLKAQKKHYREVLEECQKRKDTLLHEILLIDNYDLEDRASLEHSLILKQRDNELRRKAATNNIQDLIAIGKKFNINSAIGCLKDFSNKRDLQGFDKEHPITYRNRVELKLTYKNDVERARLIKKYKYKYDEMKNDVANKTLYFYNHVGLGKMRSKLSKNRHFKTSKSR